MEISEAIQFFSLDTFFKLLAAAALSLIIGLERELKRKPVGLKTSLVISTFSCLLTIISIETAYIAEGSDFEGVNITMDPLRLAAQIVSGIGFLGAGVILKRDNDSISGLTTAAMIWGAGGIGIAVAAGFVIEATITVLIVLFGIELVPPLLTKYGPKRLRMEEVKVRAVVSNKKSIQSVTDHLKKEGMIIESLTISDFETGDQLIRHIITVRLSRMPEKEMIDLYEDIASIENVKQVEVEAVH